MEILADISLAGFGFLKDILGAVAGAAGEVVKTSLPGLIAGAAGKHIGTPVARLFSKTFPTDAIPVGNLLLGIGIGALSGGGTEAALATGFQMMTGATGIHQILKIGSRALVEKGLGKLFHVKPLAAAVGPGDRLSI